MAEPDEWEEHAKVLAEIADKAIANTATIVATSIANRLRDRAKNWKANAITYASSGYAGEGFACGVRAKALEDAADEVQSMFEPKEG